MQSVAQGVRVTYRGREAFVGRFDGIDYEFDPETTIILGHDAAAHIFGYGQDRDGKIKSFARNGWMSSTDHYKQALGKLADFQFDEVSAVFNVPSTDPLALARPPDTEEPDDEEEGEQSPSDSPDDDEE